MKTVVSDGAPGWVKEYLGFKKRYNFILWVIFGGALFAFCLARLEFYNPRLFARDAMPGDWYWFGGGRYRVGIYLHIATILPAGLLAPIQFIPKIRYKAILAHRINGYAVITLIIASIPGALMVMRHSMGGGLDLQSAVVGLAAATLFALVMAYINIKRLQIDQHRKWMLRAMIWMSLIITARILMFIAAKVISDIGGYYTIWSCDEAQFTLGDSQAFTAEFPQCAQLGPSGLILVSADYSNRLHYASALRSTFGISLWLALVLHVFGAELYISLTQDESERLRRVSYQRQLDAGYANPGSAGLTADHFGNSSWVPPKTDEQLADGLGRTDSRAPLVPGP